ncbi:MAG: FxsA family protein [Methylocella sp.]
MLRLRSNGTMVRQPVVRLPALFATYLALWLGAELAAFAAVIHLIGFAGAILVCILTSLAGLSTLRRIGLSAVLRLRQTVFRRAKTRPGLSREALLDGTLAGLGAVLLILPGFVSDFVGLALAAPSFRFWVIERLKLGKFGRSAARTATDLAPWEWSRYDGPLP